ncbi:biotin-dependent carboxyltransferase family protein [Serinicoccus chungangensis]|uniref:5-oxoprolinase subunit C family protein n=1 Tax=Serinicoccus chungangensis TaxID=767452 RepID=UPI00111BC363|nr:biotin-dependent carboxyltransferase family protein [Serinicoccus chungangensis]
MPALEVLDVGPLVLVQDLGRPGLAELGVGRSGAADRGAHRLGARILAQDEALAGLEVLLGGCRLRARGAVTVAITGAEAPASVDGRAVGWGAPLRLEDGQTLRLGAPTSGLRTYLAVRGGLDVPPVLGSRSRDTLAALGPEPVRPGDVLPVGRPPAEPPTVDQVAPPADPPAALPLHLAPGPRGDWLADLEALTAQVWTVSDRSDRVGTRLTGRALTRAPAYRDRELPSEPMVRGCVQVPADGQPVVFGADHPVTGGYPVVAVVEPVDMDRLSQLGPGTQVRLTWAQPGLARP